MTIDVGIVARVQAADIFSREVTKLIYALILHYYRIVFNFVLFFHSGSDDSNFIPDIIDLATKESIYVIS